MSEEVQFKLSNPVHFFALGFGSGLIRPAPGTWGTLVAVPIYLGLLGALPEGALAYLMTVFASFILGVFLCHKTALDVGVHDHSAIVWDEIVGFLITMTLIAPSWQNIVIGFMLFRIFDILKPWPIKWLDKRVHGGFGIMIDDVIAGVFAWVVLFFSQAYLAKLIY